MQTEPKHNKKPIDVSFEDQVLVLRPSLLAYAHKLTGNYEDAEDLLQETLLKSISNKHKYVSNVNLKGWLMTMMRNIFINEYRRTVVRNTTVDPTEDLHFLNIPQKSGFSTPDGAYSLMEIENVISKIKEDCRDPFMMYVAGFKYKEIADKMDLPIGTIKSRIFFARKQLCESLKEYQFKM